MITSGNIRYNVAFLELRPGVLENHDLPTSCALCLSGPEVYSNSLWES